jgi:hypothetical protein
MLSVLALEHANHTAAWRYRRTGAIGGGSIAIASSPISGIASLHQLDVLTKLIICGAWCGRCHRSADA